MTNVNWKPVTPTFTPSPTAIPTRTIAGQQCPVIDVQQGYTCVTVAAGLYGLENPGVLQYGVALKDYKTQNPEAFNAVMTLATEIINLNLPEGEKLPPGKTAANLPAHSSHTSSAAMPAWEKLVYHLDPNGGTLALPARFNALLVQVGEEALAGAVDSAISGDPLPTPDTGEKITLEPNPDEVGVTDEPSGADDQGSSSAALDDVRRGRTREARPEREERAKKKENPEATADAGTGRVRDRKKAGDAGNGEVSARAGTPVDGGSEADAARRKPHGGSGVFSGVGAWLQGIGKNPSGQTTTAPGGNDASTTAAKPSVPSDEAEAAVIDDGKKSGRAARSEAPTEPSARETRKADQAALDARVAEVVDGKGDNSPSPYFPVTQAAVLYVARHGEGTPAEKLETINTLISALEKPMAPALPDGRPGVSLSTAAHAQTDRSARASVLAALDAAGVKHDENGNPPKHETNALGLYVPYHSLEAGPSPSTKPEKPSRTDDAGRVASNKDDKGKPETTRAPREGGLFGSASKAEEPKTEAPRADKPEGTKTKPPHATRTDTPHEPRVKRSETDAAGLSAGAKLHADGNIIHTEINSWDQLGGETGWPRNAGPHITPQEIIVIEQFLEKKEAEGMPAGEAYEIAYHGILGSGLGAVVKANKGDNNAPAVQALLADLEQKYGFEAILPGETPAAKEPAPATVAAKPNSSGASDKAAARRAASEARTEANSAYREAMADARAADKAAHQAHKAKMDDFESRLAAAKKAGDTTQIAQISKEMETYVAQYTAETRGETDVAEVK